MRNFTVIGLAVGIIFAGFLALNNQARAGTKCTVYNGVTVCCMNSGGNYTYCY
jgi:hypothetical protein